MIFKDLKIHIVPTKLSPEQVNQLVESIRREGGTTIQTNKGADIVVTKLTSAERVSKHLDMRKFDTPVVSVDWVHQSLSSHTCLPPHKFALDLTPYITTTTPSTLPPAAEKRGPPSPPIVVVSDDDHEVIEPVMPAKRQKVSLGKAKSGSGGGSWWYKGRWRSRAGDGGGKSRGKVGLVPRSRDKNREDRDVTPELEFDSQDRSLSRLGSVVGGDGLQIPDLETSHHSDTDSLKSYATSVRSSDRSSEREHSDGEGEGDASHGGLEGYGFDDDGGGFDGEEEEEEQDLSGGDTDDTEDEKNAWDLDVPVDKRFVNSKFECWRPHPLKHHNEHLVSLLKLIERKRELNSEDRNALAYRHAIAALISYPRPIQSWKEARKIKGVGDKIAMMIKQYLKTGTIREAENIKKDEWFRVVDEFASVYAVGPRKAREWYNMGYRSVPEVRENEKGLNRLQMAGLELWDDFRQKMTRQDVGEMLGLIRKALDEVAPRCVLQPVGGYRRGKELSGDLDVVVTHPEYEGKAAELLGKIVGWLKLKGYMKHVLWYGEGSENDAVSELKLLPGKKYSFDHLAKCFSAIQQPTTKTLRQVDIIVSPPSLFACAVVGWTGSKQFERGLRDWCKRGKKGYHFASHGLFDRRTNKIVNVKSEREVFEVLGLPWFEPEERNA
ncbi:hypothetical protein HDV00_007561 [Rhizophlyctis rosea]|nr:hypothetical protein HDV00_007561 [Rhizophlyctis rosea]